MKEVEKNEIKRLSDRLDAIHHQQADLSLVDAAEKYAELEKEKATIETELVRLREVQGQKLSKEAQKLMVARTDAQHRLRDRLCFKRHSPLIGPTNVFLNRPMVHISIIFRHRHIAHQ